MSTNYLDMQEIRDALFEVRKAYRLIFDFQARVLDLITFIKGRFDFEYDGGYAKFSNQSPRNGSGDLKSWAWDWLNLYFYEFNFKPKMVNGDKIKFSIFLMCDSGYFDAKKLNTVNALNLDTFNSPEDSVTKLIFVVGKNTWSHYGQENWKNVEFTTSQSGQHSDEKGIMVFKSYNLENFVDEESANKSLLDFKHYCESFEISMPFVERKFV